MGPEKGSGLRHWETIYLSDAREGPDSAGTFAGFTTASRLGLRDHPETPPPFAVTTLSREASAVTARRRDGGPWQVMRQINGPSA
jgi:hypothetical protein